MSSVRIMWKAVKADVEVRILTLDVDMAVQTLMLDVDVEVRC
jgi:hypothetical protein